MSRSGRMCPAGPPASRHEANRHNRRVRETWWREGVFYQIYPRSFQDSNGDGVGDLPGITARLDHLNDGTPRSLGIDAIWLSPFYRSPMADFGYDVSDYRDVDPTFGNLAEFDRLLSEAHRRNIRVIVDIVPGHTSDQHPWFKAARSSRTDPKRDYFVWAEPRRRNWDLDEVHEIHRGWRKVLDSYDGDRMAVGEIGVRNLRRHVRYYGEDDELQLSFNFHFLEQPWVAERFRAVVEEWERLLPAHAWPDYTLSNHDRSRATSRYGPDRAAVAAVPIPTLRRAPVLRYSAEIQVNLATLPPARVVDIDGRDPERAPMQWDASPNAGFTTGDPWLPIAADHAKRNVEAQRDDPASLFSFYRRLSWFRKSSPALRRGSYRTIAAPRGVFAYAREADGDRLLVALNFTNAPLALALGSGSARIGLSTDQR